MRTANQSPDEILETQLSGEEFDKLFHARNRFDNSHQVLSKQEIPASWKLIPMEYRNSLCKLYRWLAGVCEELHDDSRCREVVAFQDEVVSIYDGRTCNVTGWHLVDVGEYRYYLTPDGALLRSLGDGVPYKMSYIRYRAAATSDLSKEEIISRNNHCYLNQEDLAALVVKLKL